MLGDTWGELGGSELLKVLHRVSVGVPPALDVQKERALQSVLRQLIRSGRLSSTHDCSEGGLLVALAESCIADLGRMMGAQVHLQTGSVAPHAFFFGEDASRAIVSFSPSVQVEVEASCRDGGISCSVVGEVIGQELRVEGVLRLSTEVLSKAWRSGIPSVLRTALER